jgi:hypothetical protein
VAGCPLRALGLEAVALDAMLEHQLAAAGAVGP